MPKRNLMIFLLTVVLFSFTAFYAQQMYEGKVSVIARNLAGNIFGFMGKPQVKDAAPEGFVQKELSKEELNRLRIDKSECQYETDGEEVLEGEFLESNLNDQNFKLGEHFKVIFKVKNTGNTPWFSVNSGCSGPIINLGTDKIRDRNSDFYYRSNYIDSYWSSPNRIEMNTPKVNPGEIAEFVFWVEVPKNDDILIEYFTPVVEGQKWLDNAGGKLEFRVGGFDLSLLDRTQFALRSRAVSEIDLYNERQIIVDVSDQIMDLKIGDDVLARFPVSTGAYRTPTPFGTTRIKFKQEVRVGSAWPHYVMPKFMWFRDGGYGIHALPSLRNDGGTYWREARNHIQTRVSHGCVRLLPEDAELAFAFAEAGTLVTVQP